MAMSKPDGKSEPDVRKEGKREGRKWRGRVFKEDGEGTRGVCWTRKLWQSKGILVRKSSRQNFCQARWHHVVEESGGFCFCCTMCELYLKLNHEESNKRIRKV